LLVGRGKKEKTHCYSTRGYLSVGRGKKEKTHCTDDLEGVSGG